LREYFIEVCRCLSCRRKSQSCQYFY